MTDGKKASDGAEPFDWDQALLEWEEKSFDPEVAKDVVPDKPAPVSRPLYRPPTPALPRPQAKAPPPPPAAPSVPEGLDADAADADEGKTLITHVPNELLRREEPPRTARAGAREPRPEGDGIGLPVDDSLPEPRAEQLTISG
jgi:hypothetical protein